MKKTEKLTQSELIENGWTKKLIQDFLGEPELKANPHYKSAGHPMKLWTKQEVEKAQESIEFKEAFAKSQNRKISAQKAVETKSKKLLVEVEQKTIKVKCIPDKQLVKDTLTAKENWYNYKDSYNDNYILQDRDVSSVSKETLHRWIVNYIRHNLTDYDEDMYSLAGKVGIGKAYLQYKSKVLEEIAKIYPKYAAECKRQMPECIC